MRQFLNKKIFLIFLFSISFSLSTSAHVKTKPVIKWKFETPLGAAGRIWENSASKNGFVYFGSADSNIYALDVQTGTKVWNFKTDGPVYSEIAIYDDYLYAGSDDGFLYKLNLIDGTEIWKFNIHEDTPLDRILPDEPINTNRGFDFHGPSAIESDSVVYVGSPDTHLYAIDAANGTKIWKYKTNDIVRSKPAIAEGKVVFGSYDGNIYALNKSTGEEEWAIVYGVPVTTSPLIYNGVIYIGTRASFSFGPALQAVNLADGSGVWTLAWGNGSWVESDATLYDGTIYVGSSFWGHTTSVNPETGSFNWTRSVGGGAYSNPALKDNSHFSGTLGIPNSFSGNRNLTSGSLLKLDRLTGEELWRYSFSPIPGFLEWGISAQPELVDSLILVGGLDGIFYAFEERLNRIQKFGVVNNAKAEHNKPIKIYWEAIDGSSVTLNDTPVAQSDSIFVTLFSDTTFTLISTLDNIADTSYLNMGVFPAYEINRAENKPAFRNEADGSIVQITFANDGNRSSFMQGVASDSQWIYIDLEESFDIKRILIRWNFIARARNYQLDISDDAENWETIYSIEGASGPSDNISDLQSRGRYVRLLAVPGTSFRLYEFEVYNAVEEVTGLSENGRGSYPQNFRLEQNYPNPFNPTTQIDFSIPNSGMVLLNVYNMIGEEVATLVNETKQAGNYQVEFDGSKLASGIYLYRLVSNDFALSRKMLLLK